MLPDVVASVVGISGRPMKDEEVAVLVNVVKGLLNLLSNGLACLTTCEARLLYTIRTAVMQIKKEKNHFIGKTGKNLY